MASFRNPTIMDVLNFSFKACNLQIRMERPKTFNKRPQIKKKYGAYC